MVDGSLRLAEDHPTQVKPAALIAARQLCKRFRNGGAVVNVLQDLDFDLRPAETVAIIGASGIGKSTLLHIMGTLDRPDRQPALQRRKHLRLPGRPAGQISQRIYRIRVSVPSSPVRIQRPGEHDDAGPDIGLESGKRQLSSMAPLIAVADGRVRFVAGSNGGPRILTSVLLAFLAVVDWDMDAQEAVAAPRFHHQWRPDALEVEAETPADVVEALRARGHTVKVTDEITSGVEAIVVDPKTGRMTGGADPRRDSSALGID